MKLRSARRRTPQQIDMFAADPRKIGGKPAWSALPIEIQTALTELMTRLILQHAGKNRIGSIAEVDRDL
jgi:hypothetical protein